MKICIVGQGYIGLPTAALFAKNGCEVLGVDVNEEIVDKLNQGIAHIEEPGITEGGRYIHHYSSYTLCERGLEL